MLAAAIAVMVEVACAEDDASHAALTHAVQRYLNGDAAGARAELQALLAQGPSLAPEVRRDALLWLGDVLYAEGGAGAARNVFEALLDEAPDYPIDPFAHSPEVVAFFEEVRKSVTTPPPPPVDDLPLPDLPPRKPWPWRSVVPFGIGYFVDGEPLAGTVTGGLQLAALGVSIGTAVQLYDRYPPSGEFPEERSEEYAAFHGLLWTNRGAFAAGWLAYVAPIAIDTGVWAGRRRLTVSVSPTTVTFSGRF